MSSSSSSRIPTITSTPPPQPTSSSSSSQRTATTTTTTSSTSAASRGSASGSGSGSGSAAFASTSTAANMHSASSHIHRSHSSQGSFSRSKSHLPHPRVLPFPEDKIPAIPKSPSASPLPSPGPPSRTHSSLGHTTTTRLSVDSASIGMMITGSSDSGENMATHARRSTTPPVRSPLSGSSTPIHSHPFASVTRSRASTSPTPRPILVPPPTNTRTNDVFRDLTASNLNIGSSSQLSSSSSPPKPGSPPVNKETPKPPPPAKKPSLPPSSQPQTLQLLPSAPTKIVSDHIYESFLAGQCADVRIWVRKWGIGWRVHKVVLVQAGFFHSMFLGGFSEMNARYGSINKGKNKATFDDDWVGEEMELTFDDPNITRAAFEIALSRLYSPFPRLHFPSSLLPTPSDPLSPCCNTGHTVRPTDLESLYHKSPKQTHLASPRILLSLLATAIYLGQTALMREVLTMILRTISPATIGRYLGFAMGDGIGPEEWVGQHSAPAKGMEDVAQVVSLPDNTLRDARLDSPALAPEIFAGIDQPSSTSGTGSTAGSTPTVRHLSHLEIPDDGGSPISDADSFMPHYYGFSSDKIGEACACWLARWGVDLLEVESGSSAPVDLRVWGHRGLPARFIRAVLSSDSFIVKSEIERYRVARKVLDMRRSGWENEMDATGDISTGTVSQEGSEEWDEDEAELEAVFAEGIYYTHMSFQDLSSIAEDIDPNTSTPYAPLSVLQSAHWAAADLQSRILGSPSTEDGQLGLTQPISALISSSQPKRRFTSRSRVSSAATNASSTGSVTSPHAKVYHPVPGDDTHRIGAGGLVFTINTTPTTSSTNASGNSGGVPSIPGLPDLGPEGETASLPDGSIRRHRPPPQSENTCFGLQNGSRTMQSLQSQHALSLAAMSLGSNGDSVNKKPETNWTTLEPFRFSVEFWGIEKLAEKERAYSSTHFYAGSWFNVYVQPIRKKDKGIQLGIYLQRQNSSEAFPEPSSPPSLSSSSQDSANALSSPGTGLNARRGEFERSDSAAMLESSLAARFGLNASSTTATPSPDRQRPGLTRSLSIPPVSIGSPIRQGFAGLPGGRDTREEVNSAPYQDTRPVIKAYFSISCASALGSALIRFSSAPDSFTISQSWGWKSSALRSEEYLSNMGTGAGGGSSLGLLPSDKERLEDGVLGWVGTVGLPGSDAMGGEVEGGSGTGGGGSLRATVVVGLI